MTSSDDPVRELTRELHSLKEVNRVLLAENESLAERAEETLLLGLISEKATRPENEDAVLEVGLEQIAMLKDIGLCSYWQNEGDAVSLKALFRTFSSEGMPSLRLAIDSDVGQQIFAETSAVTLRTENSRGPFATLEALGMNACEILVVPGLESSGPRGVYLFAHAEPTQKLESLRPLIVRAVEIISSRVVILRLLDSLRKLNAELDLRIAERTRDLTAANAALALALDEQRRAQEQLLHSQKMEAIGQLAGGVAHDFNNMLAGIVCGAELLKHRLRGGEPSNLKHISMILDSADRAAGLTKMLLSFARRQPIDSTSIDLHRVIQEAVVLLKSTLDRRIQLDVDLHADRALVFGDFSQLQSVFINLGINASHAMPLGGTLRFSTRGLEVTEALRRDLAHELAPGRYIEVQVQDSGEGISPAHLSRIFEPFFTTKPQGKGTGLGLSAALGTVAQHRGTIRVESALGVGTLFRVLLPITTQDMTESLPPEPPIQGNGVILFVDDEPVIRAAGTALLESLGYTVIAAENGNEAVEIFSARCDEIDLVVLDMIMPERNGRDTFYALRAIRPGVKVVVSSGFSLGEDLQDLRDNGLAGFIPKPFRTSELSRVIKDALNGDSPAHGHPSVQ